LLVPDGSRRDQRLIPETCGGGPTGPLLRAWPGWRGGAPPATASGAQDAPTWGARWLGPCMPLQTPPEPRKLTLYSMGTGIGTWTHEERPPRSCNGRQTLGLVVDNIIDGYQHILFESVAHSAREQGVNLLVFAGGRLPAPLFDLIGRENVDALLVVSATIGHQVGRAGVSSFCKRFEGMPVCSIGLEVPGTTPIVPMGTPGLQALITHLMADHGRQKLAFIRGLGADGAERFETFRTCLNEFGVPLREELIVDGRYVRESGRQAIRILCDERRVNFDGLVAANDYMALGAIDALEERGIAVPNDVAVVGFDDIEDARHALVPLTTVRQPIRELGRRAVQLALKQLSGRAVGDVGPIVCHPVKRRSCGCVIEAPFTRRPSNPAEKFSSAESAFMARRDLVLADLARTAQGELGNVGYKWEDRLFSAISEELRTGEGNPFLAANEELSRRVFRSSGDVSTWQRVLATLRFHVLDCIEDTPNLRSVAETAFNDAALVSASVVAREENQRRAALERLLRNVIRTGNALVNAPATDQVAPILVRHLDAAGIGSCYLSLYEDASRDRSQLVVGYDRHLSIQKLEVPELYPTRQLIPPGLFPQDRGFVYVVQPLTYGANSVGYVLSEYQQEDGIFFEVLRDQISGALHAIQQ